MSLLRTVIVAVASLLVLATLAFGASPLGGVGEEAFDYWDASDDAEHPSDVWEPGTYSAFLHAPEDQDWYGLARDTFSFSGGPEDPACVAVDFTGDVHASSHIWVPEDTGEEYVPVEYYAGSSLSVVNDATMALVVPMFSEVRFGLASEPVLEGGVLHGSGAYNFSIAVHTLNEVANQPQHQDGLPTCLAPSIDEGKTFNHAFDLEDPSSLTFSATEAEDVKVELEKPDGDTETLVEKTAEGAFEMIALEEGTHTLRVSGMTESSSPFMGFTFGPDDDDDDDDDDDYNGRPCEPNC